MTAKENRMKKVGVAILGLGTVGGGTYEILTRNHDLIKETQGLDVSVEAVLEINRERALSLGIREDAVYSNIAEVVSNPNVDIVVEVIGGVEPAKSFVLAALHSAAEEEDLPGIALCPFTAAELNTVSYSGENVEDSLADKYLKEFDKLFKASLRIKIFLV